MDRITKSLLDAFASETDLLHLPEDKQFEHFASYLTANRFLAESFDTGEIVTTQPDGGIDGIALVVNGALVTDADLVAEFETTNGYLDATFIFVQADRSASFDSAKIGQFGFGVSDFFSTSPQLPRGARTASAAAVMTALYDRSRTFRRGNPVCRLYYVTTGRVTPDAVLEARRSGVVADLRQLGIFRDVDFTLVGADEIQRLYNQTRNAITREFTFDKKTVMPEMPGVTEAYIGLVPAQDFVVLLDDGNGGIQRSLFYDNVRDFQDYNPVNSEMKATLESESGRLRFALMNNGVTIVARSLRTTGNRVCIEDFQVVNGCQTSHVLFDHREHLDPGVYLPLRLIATQDDAVLASIAKATNRQTEVKAEQLIALSDFQKKLEAYCLTFPPAQQLLYERRSRQYDRVARVEKTRIITPSSLIRAYASIFLEEPHRTTRDYKRLLERIGTSIFGPDDRLEPYYYAASAVYRLEFLFRNARIAARFKPARYQILLAARLLQAPDKPPRANSHEMVRYCETLIGPIWDAGPAEQLFARATEVVDSTAAGNFDRDRIRTQPFTEELKRNCLLPPA